MTHSRAATHRVQHSSGGMRLARLLLVLAALGLAANVALAVYAVRQPSDGWNLEPRPEGLVFSGVRTEAILAVSPLHQGDMLLAVDERLAGDLLAQSMRGGGPVPAGWRAGGVVAYSVLRDGVETSLDVPLFELPWSAWFEPPDSATAPLPLRIVVPLLGLVVLLRRPSDSTARVFFMFTYVAFLGLPGSLYAVRPLHQVAELVTPGLFWPSFGLQEVGFVLTVTLLLHLFLGFPRPNRVAHWSVPALYLAYPALTMLNAFGSWGDAPGFWGRQVWVLTHAWVLALAVGVLTAAAHGFRSSMDGAARQQASWVVWGIGLALAPMLALALIGIVVPSVEPYLNWHIAAAAIGIFPASVAVAILRYRLWDIDLVLRRTLVYSVLTGAVVLVYAAGVAIAGLLLQRLGADLLLALVGAGCVAALFLPLRERLQRAVNRLLFGDRDSPYEVVAHLGRRLETALAQDAVLPTIVESVSQALRLSHASIWLIEEETLHLAACQGVPPCETIVHDAPAIGTLYATGDGLQVEDFDSAGAYRGALGGLNRVFVLPLAYGGSVMGALCLAPPGAGDTFSATDRRLLRTLAGQAGAAVHGVQLTTALRRSRERLVASQDEERRRIQRDLHDGLGPTLASLRLRLAGCRQLASDAGELREELDRVDDLVAQASADIRRLVYDLRPPALDQLGLLPALRQQVERFGREAGVDARFSAAPDLVIPAVVQVAVFRVVQEALLNAQKHARAAHVDVRLERDGNGLVVRVGDDGVGMELARHQGPNDPGTGLRSMRERAEMLGGALEVESRRGAGTAVVLRFSAMEGRGAGGVAAGAGAA